MTCGIYQIINTINNKIYIGSSAKLERRWLYHRSDLRSHKHHNLHLQAAWNKYGEKAFKFEVLEFCKIEDLIIIEQYYLDWLEPFHKERGYNIARIAQAAMRGRAHTIATRQKISIKAKGRIPSNKGKPMSEEQKIKISKANTGKHLSEATRKKMSSITKGKVPWIKGRHHSEKTKELLRQINRDVHRGEDSISARLNWDQVREIRKMYAVTTTQQLAKIYKMSVGCIKHIIYHASWYDPNYIFVPKVHKC